jgi:hypothetical protein
MGPEQLKEWRDEQFANISKKAVKLANLMSEKDLRQRSVTRTEVVRR